MIAECLPERTTPDHPTRQGESPRDPRTRIECIIAKRERAVGCLQRDIAIWTARSEHRRPGRPRKPDELVPDHVDVEAESTLEKIREARQRIERHEAKIVEARNVLRRGGTERSEPRCEPASTIVERAPMAAALARIVSTDVVFGLIATGQWGVGG